MTHLAHCWAVHPGENELINLIRRGGLWRWPFVIPADGHFDPDDTNVLAEGMTHQEMADVQRTFGAAGLIACIMPHSPGDIDGDGYHSEYNPRLDPHVVTRYCHELFVWLANQGIGLWGVQFGNELDYSPRTTHSWPAYLDDCVAATSIARDEALAVFGNNFQMLSGGHHGRDTYQGRRTLNARFLELDLADRWDMWLSVHGNRRTIEDVEAEIDWVKSNGAIPGVTEDRANGPNSDFFRRATAWAARGARIVTCFASRNVNYNDANPGCLWGPNQKRKVNTGASWTCAGFQRVDYDLLTQVAEAFGTLSPGVDLPMDEGGTEPPQPPNVNIDQAWHHRCAAHHRFFVELQAANPHVLIRSPGANKLKANEAAKSNFVKELQFLGLI